LISVAVVGVMFLILVARIIVLWLLVIFSPLVFILQVLPYTQPYARQWWEKFINQVIVGPIMAFMLWLTLSLAHVSLGENIEQLAEEPSKETGFISVTISKLTQLPHLLSYVCGIAMLIGCLMVPQKLGVVGGQFAGKVMGKIEGMAKGAVKSGFGLKPLARYTGATLAAKELTGRAARGIERKIKIPITPEAREARRIRLKGKIEEWVGGKAGAKARAEEELRYLERKRLEEQLGPLEKLPIERLENLLAKSKKGTREYEVFFHELARLKKLKAKDFEEYINLPTLGEELKKRKDISRANFARDEASVQGGWAPYFIDYNYGRDEKDHWYRRGEKSDRREQDLRKRYDILSSIKKDYGRLTSSAISNLKESDLDVREWGAPAAMAVLSLDNKELKGITEEQKGMIRNQLQAIKKDKVLAGQKELKEDENGRIVEAEKTFKDLAEEKLEKLGWKEGAETGARPKQGKGKIVLTPGARFEMEKEERLEKEQRIRNIQEFQKSKETEHFSSALKEPEKLKVSRDKDLSKRKQENEGLERALGNLSKQIQNLAEKIQEPRIKEYADKFRDWQKKLIDLSENKDLPGLELQRQADALSNNIRITFNNLQSELNKIIAKSGGKKEEETSEESEKQEA
ncbi:hypothetical protein DRQ26_05745, partial [bacterium]